MGHIYRSQVIYKRPLQKATEALDVMSVIQTGMNSLSLIFYYTFTVLLKRATILRNTYDLYL